MTVSRTSPSPWRSESSSMPRLEQGVGGGFAFTGQQGHGGALQQAVSLRPRPSGARPSTSQLSFSESLSSGLEYSRTRGDRHVAGDQHADLVVDVGAQRQHVQPRVAHGAAEGSTMPRSMVSFWP
jgi:hypothetical protein